MKDSEFLSYRDCLKRFPRLCAAIMRNGYLTETEAGAVVRDWIRKRAGRYEYQSSNWTDLNSDNLRSILGRMRSPELRRYLWFNVGIVRAYVLAYAL